MAMNKKKQPMEEGADGDTLEHKQQKPIHHFHQKKEKFSDSKFQIPQNQREKQVRNKGKQKPSQKKVDEKGTF